MAELLFQTLEAFDGREGHDVPLKFAPDELLENLTVRGLHSLTGKHKPVDEYGIKVRKHQG